MSSSLGLGNGSYAVLFLWGTLGISIIVVTFLLLCTSLGNPLKRRLSHLSPKVSGKSGQLDTSELEAHTPQSPGTPAPPYEWILRITPPPPPPPTAHFPSVVAHVAPTLTHRFSDIPRVPSGHGLGIQTKEDLVGEKEIAEASQDTGNLHSRNFSSCAGTDQGVLASNFGQVTPRLRSVAESETVPLEGV